MYLDISLSSQIILRLFYPSKQISDHFLFSLWQLVRQQMLIIRYIRPFKTIWG